MQTYTIKVKAGSKKGPLVELGVGGKLTVYVRERAIDGEANAAVIKTVAAHFGVAKSLVTIVHGRTAHTKTIQILA